MTDWTSVQLPPPTDWQSFERWCHRLWMKIWDDPDAQRNGRGGQAQHGVDIFGTPRGDTRCAGIQCKGKDTRFGEALTETELRAEVAKARTFVPPLGKFILATTVDSDQAIQRVAREISDEHATTGQFSVHVYSWPEIQSRLSQYPELIEEFYGFPRSLTNVSLGAQHSEAILANTEKLLLGQAALMQRLSAPNLSIADNGQVGTHAQLDVARDLIRNKAPQQALSVLKSIEEREWVSASPEVRFRIRTNCGAAKLALGHYADASADFLAAFEIDSTSDKAVANRALALMLSGRDAEAVLAAREAISLHPSSSTTWSAFINIVSRLEPNQSLPVPPATLAENADVCFALGNASAARSDLFAAEIQLRRALRGEPDSYIIQSRLAEIVLAQTDAAGRLYIGASYNPDELARIEEARELLSSAWASIKLTDLAADAGHIASNLSLVYWLLGDATSARSTVDEALPRAPNDTALLRQQVRLSVTGGDVRQARQALNHLTSESAEDYSILVTQVLVEEGRGREALQVLESMIRTNDAPNEAQLAQCIYASLVCKVDPANAQDRFASLPIAKSAIGAQAALIFAQSLRASCGDSTARPYLSQARELTATAGDERTQLLLADTLMEFGEYSEAVTVFRKHVSPLVDTASLRGYLRCLLELDQRNALLSLAKAIPEPVLSRASYQWLLGVAAIRAGSLSAARQHFEKCLETDPGHRMARFRWAEVVLRQGDRALVEQWLRDDPPDEDALNADELLVLGSIHSQLDRVEATANTFYAARRKFPDDPRVHLAFIGAVLFRDRPQWQVGSESSIAEDMAVALVDSQGQQETFIIEPAAAFRTYDGEIAPESPLSARLLGRKVGDVVIIGQNDFGTRSRTIAWVKHKFVHALHVSMNSFNTRFPESNALLQVDLPEGTPEQQLAPILKSVDSRSRRRREVLSLYVSSQLPIAAVSQLLGRSPLDVWRDMIGPQGVQIATCAGTQPEREAAFSLLEERGRRYLVEPMTLLALYVLDLADLIVQVFGRPMIVQATLEEIRTRILHHQLHPSGHMTLFSHGGQHYRADVSREDIAREVSMLQGLLRWSEGNCDVVPAVPSNDLNPDQAQALQDALGLAVYDSLLAANGANLVLVSDDAHLRGLALGEFGISGVWVQAVLMYAKEKGYLGPREYRRAVVTLASWRHHFTSVSADDLCQAALDANWKVSPAFQAVASTLDLRVSDLPTLARVVSEFLQRVWSNKHFVTEEDAERLTYALLVGINPSASPRHREFASALAILARHGRLPWSALGAVVGWYRGHFLLPHK